MKCFLEDFNMISIQFLENKLFFIDYISNKIELGSYTELENKSKMPLHKLENGVRILTIQENYWNFCKSINSIYSSIWLESPEMALLYTLYMVIFSFGIKICTPIKATAFGCNSEILYTIAYIIKNLRINSSLTIINHEINIDGSNDFLNPIMNVKDLDFNALICDYEQTNLKDKNFNMAVISSKELYDNLEDVIKESNRILKDNGKLIFVVDSNPEFEATVKNVCGEFREYAVSEDKKIIISDKIDFENTMAYLDFNLKELTKSDIKKLISKLNNDIDNAIMDDDTYKKIKLIDLKENLICFMLYENDRDFYANKICEFKDALNKS